MPKTVPDYAAVVERVQKSINVRIEQAHASLVTTDTNGQATRKPWRHITVADAREDRWSPPVLVHPDFAIRLKTLAKRFHECAPSGTLTRAQDFVARRWGFRSWKQVTELLDQYQRQVSSAFRSGCVVLTSLPARDDWREEPRAIFRAAQELEALYWERDFEGGAFVASSRDVFLRLVGADEYDTEHLALYGARLLIYDGKAGMSSDMASTEVIRFLGITYPELNSGKGSKESRSAVYAYWLHGRFVNVETLWR